MPDVAVDDAKARVRALATLARTDALGAFEAALDLLDALVRGAASRAEAGEPDVPDASRPARLLVRLIGRLLSDDARGARHEIDRESGWFELFGIWLGDDAGVLDGFEALLADVAVLDRDRRLLVRLATDELGDLPLPFPGAGEPDLRRVVLRAARARLESLIATLLKCDGRHGYAREVAEVVRRDTGSSASLVEALLRSDDAGAAIAAAERALDDPREIHPARIQALLAEALGPGRARRSARRHLETAFLRSPSAKAFRAVKESVPDDQWPQVRARLLGHLQKHQREPTLVFELYWSEGLLLDADGLVVTQPVDPDVLARAAESLATHSPVVAAGWLLVAAHRLADSYPRSRWNDVVRHLVVVRDLTARGESERGFDRVLRTFRFRHAHSPELLTRLSQAGL